MREAAENFRVAILAALGHAPDVIEPGRIHRFSTSGRASDKAGWCQLFEDGRAGVFGDFRSGMSSVWTAQRRELMTPAERADMARLLAKAKAQREAQQRQQQADNAQRNAALWAKAVPVTEDDPVSLYLRRRGLAGPVPEHLRLHPRTVGLNTLAVGVRVRVTKRRVLEHRQRPLARRGLPFEIGRAHV